jgi:hypothetical protein
MDRELSRQRERDPELHRQSHVAIEGLPFSEGALNTFVVGIRLLLTRSCVSCRRSTAKIDSRQRRDQPDCPKSYLVTFVDFCLAPDGRGRSVWDSKGQSKSSGEIGPGRKGGRRESTGPERKQIGKELNCFVISTYVE